MCVCTFLCHPADICHLSKYQTRCCCGGKRNKTIIQRAHNTFSSSDMRYISRSPFVSAYVATLNCHYKFNTRSKLYCSFPTFGIKNYSRDVLLCLKTQTSVRPGDKASVTTIESKLFSDRFWLPWDSNSNRQLQSGESN